MTGAKDWAAKLRKLIIDERDVVQADELWAAGQGQWLAGLEKEAATGGLEGPLSTLYSVVPKMLFWLGRPAEAAALVGRWGAFRRTENRDQVVVATVSEVFKEMVGYADFAEEATALVEFSKQDPSSLASLALGMELELFITTGKADEAIAQVERIRSGELPLTAFQKMIYSPNTLAKTIWRAWATKGDFQRAADELRPWAAAEPKDFAQFQQGLARDPENKAFLTSPAYRQAFEVKLPTDQVLADAWVRALEAPWKVYSALAGREKVDAEVLSVMHYCIALICSDLDEHGDDNLDDYGKGKVTPKQFVTLKKDLATKLSAAMKKEGLKQTPFWKYKGIKSLSGTP